MFHSKKKTLKYCLVSLRVNSTTDTAKYATKYMNLIFRLLHKKKLRKIKINNTKFFRKF